MMNWTESLKTCCWKSWWGAGRRRAPSNRRICSTGSKKNNCTQGTTELCTHLLTFSNTSLAIDPTKPLITSQYHAGSLILFTVIHNNRNNFYFLFFFKQISGVYNHRTSIRSRFHTLILKLIYIARLLDYVERKSSDSSSFFLKI